MVNFVFCKTFNASFLFIGHLSKVLWNPYRFVQKYALKMEFPISCNSRRHLHFPNSCVHTMTVIYLPIYWVSVGLSPLINISFVFVEVYYHILAWVKYLAFQPKNRVCILLQFYEVSDTKWRRTKRFRLNQMKIYVLCKIIIGITSGFSLPTLLWRVTTLFYENKKNNLSD